MPFDVSVDLLRLTQCVAGLGHRRYQQEGGRLLKICCAHELDRMYVNQQEGCVGIMLASESKT